MNYKLDIIVWGFIIIISYKIITNKAKLIFRLIALVLIALSVLFMGEITIVLVALLSRIVLHFLPRTE